MKIPLLNKLFPFFLAITCILASDFCDSISNNICIRNQTLINNGPILYKTNMSILIINTQLICNNSESCSISLETSGILEINNSLLISPYVNIATTKNLSIFDSQISSNGTFGKNKGSSSNENQGNAFLGLGGYCSKDNNFANLIYGKICDDPFLALPKNLSGSGGFNADSNGSFLFSFCLYKFLARWRIYQYICKLY